MHACRHLYWCLLQSFGLILGQLHGSALNALNNIMRRTSEERHSLFGIVDASNKAAVARLNNTKTLEVRHASTRHVVVAPRSVTSGVPRNAKGGNAGACRVFSMVPHVRRR